jgi:hypothetical protein
MTSIRNESLKSVGRADEWINLVSLIISLCMGHLKSAHLLVWKYLLYGHQLVYPRTSIGFRRYRGQGDECTS